MTKDQQFQLALAVGSVIGSAIVGLLRKLVINIVELNQKIALIVERIDSHEKRISRLENP